MIGETNVQHTNTGVTFKAQIKKKKKSPWKWADIALFKVPKVSYSLSYVSSNSDGIFVKEENMHLYNSSR